MNSIRQKVLETPCISFFISMIISNELYCNTNHSNRFSSSCSFYLSQYFCLFYFFPDFLKLFPIDNDYLLWHESPMARLKPQSAPRDINTTESILRCPYSGGKTLLDTFHVILSQTRSIVISLRRI